jgi:HAE1 family hydrophobic/amphiphilic exporter-1
MVHFLAGLERQLGHGTRIAILDDQAPAIQSSITDLAHEGLLGAAFAILVILVFLLSVRSTLVIAISIPLSVVIALIALWTQGESLNIMTLSGLTIAVGRVVDDSIVVLENIYRHLRNGEAKASATLTGVREVAGAVTASTLTTIAVFLPLAFIGGIVGSYTHPLALTVTLALLASLLVSLTIIPVLAYQFLKAPVSAPSPYQQPKPTVLERGYTPLIRWVAGRRTLTVLLAVLILAGSLALFPLLPTNVFGSTAESSFAFSLQLPPGTSLEHTDAAARQIEGELAHVAGIESYQAIVGTSNTAFFAAAGANVASFTVSVKSGLDGAQEVSLKLAEPAGTVQQMEDVQIPGPLGLVRLGDIATITQTIGPRVARCTGKG